MKLLIAFLLWCILFVLCWPLALLAMVAFPLIWLIALPFRLAAMVLEAALALIRALFFLPARLVFPRRRPAPAIIANIPAPAV